MRNAKQVKQAIATFVSGQKKRRDTIQALGIECLEHAKENGNTELLRYMIQGMTDAGSHDAKVVAQWAYLFGGMQSAKDKEGNFVIKFQKGNKPENVDIEGAKAQPWFSLKKPQNPAEFDFDKRAKALIKDAMKKQNMSAQEMIDKFTADVMESASNEE